MTNSDRDKGSIPQPEGVSRHPNEQEGKADPEALHSELSELGEHILIALPEEEQLPANEELSDTLNKVYSTKKIFITKSLVGGYLLDISYSLRVERVDTSQLPDTLSKKELLELWETQSLTVEEIADAQLSLIDLYALDQTEDTRQASLITVKNLQVGGFPYDPNNETNLTNSIDPSVNYVSSICGIIDLATGYENRK